MKHAGLLAAGVALLACGRGGAATGAPPEVLASAPDPGTPDASGAAGSPSVDVPRLVRDLSEPGQEFISDNLVSNESSYLQVVSALRARARRGGAYVGVGPEQNFTYLAILDPPLAFIVDVRRGNLVEHLFYRAIFDLAESRAHFLALLLGHVFEAARAPGNDASIDDLVAFTTSVSADEASWESNLKAIADRIVTTYGVPLDAGDLATLRGVARSFFDRQLGIAFEMHVKIARTFPTLGSLLTQRSPEGEAVGFLGSEAAFRTVQRLEREGRVVPVVGDFGGDRALLGVGRELRARGLTTSVVYVSNVEQYLMPRPGSWHDWIRNVLALPHAEDTLFVRSHIEMGRRHPSQMPGHRTTTVLQRFDRFERDWPRYRTFWDIAVDQDP